MRKGISFRDAHETVGQLVKFAVDQNCQLEDLKLAEFQKANKVFDAKVFDIFPRQSTSIEELPRRHSSRASQESMCKNSYPDRENIVKLKYLKTLSLIVVGILFTVLLVLSIFLAAVDPNEYKNEIENQFRASTGKTLRLNGPIELSILPRLVLEASDIEIVNEDNFHIPQFLRLSSIRISVNMFSLIRGDIEMDALTIDQLKVNLAKDERGIANWLMSQNAEEAKKEETSSKLLAVFLGGVNINNSEIKFHDEATKRRISVSDINIKISELSFEKPVELVGSIKFTDTGQELSGNAEVLGTITYGLKEKFYAFDDLKKMER